MTELQTLARALAKLVKVVTHTRHDGEPVYSIVITPYGEATILQAWDIIRQIVQIGQKEGDPHENSSND